MKKIKEIYIITFIILVLGVSSSFAASGLSTTNGLRLRKQPSTNGEVITNVNNGEEVEIIEKTGDWYKVKFNEYEGYVHSEYIKTDESELHDTPITPTNSEPISEENKKEENLQNEESNIEQPVYPQEVKVTSNVSVHIIPSMSSSKISEIVSGSLITINSTLNNWSNITYNNQSGWIRNYSIQNKTQANTPPEETNNTPNEEVPTSKVGYISSHAANLREEANTDSKILTTLTQNTQIQIISEDTDWYKVNYDQYSGYISKPLVSDSMIEVTSRSNSEARQPSEAETITKGYINVSIANIRSEANTNSSIITTMRLKAQINIVGEINDFYQIDIGGQFGYIAKRLVTDSLNNIQEPEIITPPTNQTNTGSVPQTNQSASSIVDFAMQYKGYSYVLGGTTPSGFDCSGFVYYVFNNCGYSLSRSCQVQANSGNSVSKSNLQPGDLVFFNNNSDGSIGHVGIYIGNGNFIHAANSRRGVVIDTINSGYYNTYYYSARRIN